MEQMQKYNGNTELTKEQIDILVQSNIIPKDTPAPIIKTFAKFCWEKNLSPIQKQIYLIPRKDSVSGTIRYTYQTAIDGYRTIAERTGVYAGNDDYKFDDNLDEYSMIKEKRMTPTTATATVYKMIQGQRCSFSATARWEEYFPGDKLGFMWKKMPFLMLGKCAEALALRKAFPEALGGIYTDDEMKQADVTTSEPLNPRYNFAQEKTMEKTEIKEKLTLLKSKQTLLNLWKKLTEDQQDDEEIHQWFDARRAQLKDEGIYV